MPVESIFYILTGAYLSSSSQGCLERACTICHGMIELGWFKPWLNLHNFLFRALVSNPGDSAKHNFKQTEFVYPNLSTFGPEIHEDISRGLIWLLSHQDVLEKERIAWLKSQSISKRIIIYNFLNYNFSLLHCIYYLTLHTTLYRACFYRSYLCTAKIIWASCQAYALHRH